ncbi:MAG: PAS domain S-box protein, partial [Burkholderiaceae bacterium]
MRDWLLGLLRPGHPRAEQELLREIAFRRAMEDSMPTGMRTIDSDGRITYVNPAFCRIVGLAQESLVGAEPPYPYW